MASTGEVGCIADNYYEGILQAMLSVGYSIPKKSVLFSSGPARSKLELLISAKMLLKRGYKLYATGGTHEFFTKNKVETEILYFPDEDKKPNTLDYLKEKKIDLVINIPKNLTKSELDNDYKIRRNAIDYNIPLITNARLASAFIYAICKIDINDIAVKSWDEY